MCRLGGDERRLSARLTSRSILPDENGGVRQAPGLHQPLWSPRAGTLVFGLEDCGLVSLAAKWMNAASTVSSSTNRRAPCGPMKTGVRSGRSSSPWDASPSVKRNGKRRQDARSHLSRRGAQAGQRLPPRVEARLSNARTGPGGGEIDWLYRFVADGTPVEIRARSHDRRPHPDCTAGASRGRAVTRRQGVIMQVTAILTPAEEGVMSRSTRKPARPAQAGRLRRHSSTCAKLSSFILRSRRCSLPARWSSRPLTMRNRWQVVLR